MSTVNPGLGRVLAGCGGAVLIASLFLPWSEASGLSRSGWEALSVWDLFVAITGACGIVAAVTGGRFGFFRRDLSFNAMTDIFGVVAAILIGWLLSFGLAAGASAGVGAYVGLAAALVVATGAGDFRIASLFPPAQADA